MELFSTASVVCIIGSEDAYRARRMLVGTKRMRA